MLWNRVLLLYDNSPTSLKAVEYVGKMFGKVQGVSVTLIGVSEHIPGHDLEGDAPGMDKLRASFHSMEIKQEKMKAQIGGAVDLLAKAGIQCERIDMKFQETRHLAKEIIREVQEGGFGTLVMPYRATTNIFSVLSGDLSSSVIKGLKGCTVCIVS
ncbi:MAG: universal stress protein [Deltaproteobacteria bacterium]|nr:universal stress protein [Deltaproteobacteria bacterium]